VSRLAEALAAAAQDLHELGATWALVGGLAVSTWCDPRLTRDIDIAVSVPSDKDAERLVRDLQQRGYEKLELIEQEATARLATARLVRRDLPAILIDVLFASSGIEAEIVSAARTTEVFPGVHVPVASRAHLMAMKLLARDDRPASPGSR
jgi:tRNA nucleotidyltransferase (CCA-adding enzyme)